MAKSDSVDVCFRALAGGHQGGIDDLAIYAQE
jgi:hypothetical protein